MTSKSSNIIHDCLDGLSHKWLHNNILYFVRHGSHAYGTNNETSDEDFRGIFIPPKIYFHGFKNNLEHVVRTDPDCQIFHIHKFYDLAIKNNPNVLEILFVDPEDHILIHDLMLPILEHKDKLISKLARASFLGYARQQAHRIKQHRKFLLNPPVALPDRKSLGLPDIPEISKAQWEAVSSAIKAKLELWNPDFQPFSSIQKIYLHNKLTDILSEMEITSDSKWESAARSIGLSDNYIELLQKEKQYINKIEEYKAFMDWKKNRNPKRSELEAKIFFDSKHGSHLYRLLCIGKEILQDHKLVVRRPDAPLLLEIKNGHWTYEKLIEETDRMEEEINIIYKNSTLRDMPDETFFDELCSNTVERSFVDMT